MSIVHIHVGKCGGGAINKGLHRLGFDFIELHCGNANQEVQRLLSNPRDQDLILVTIRDPIDRFISAFNFDKYEKIVIANTANKVWQTIYDTFNSVEHLVQSLVSHHKKMRSLAWLAVTESFLHMHLGLSWYLPVDKINLIDNGRWFVIRQEHLVEDFNRFLLKAGVPRVVESLPSDKDHSNFIKEIDISEPKYLSLSSRLILGEVLKNDYLILDYFFEKNMIPEKYKMPLHSLTGCI
jgi:hypothetical protein